MRVILIFQFFVINTLLGQDIKEAKEIVSLLTSPEYWGRGYTNNGMSKSADFLASRFKSYGVKPISGKNFFQDFTYSINSFPGKMEVAINGKTLTPGVDFLISGDSKGVVTSGNLVQVDSVHFINQEKKIQVILQDKLTWSPSTQLIDYTIILVDKKMVSEPPQKISIAVENKFISKFKASNVCGIIKGSTTPDSLIVLTAHYDHLGGMGDKTYFPGANDNASGIVLLLSLAKYYSENPPEYSIVFLCFAGEEAGLIGSNFFVEHSLISLKNIRFLMNLDLMGTGEEGVTIVNGSVFKMEFEWLTQINDQNNYLVKIKPRGKAANSDHYWFTEKGVRSFFMYAMGGIQAYHDVFDKAETLPLSEFVDLFHLIVDFNHRLMN
jgi:hypothetical protein